MGSDTADDGVEPRTGGALLLDTLLAEGADLAFCVPGESYLAVLDALYDRQNHFRMIVCRHEGGAANMSEAYGKLTGRPGVCFVTRGPGASHAAIGVHTAQQDSTPMILFAGQAERSHLDRGAFQEVDYRQMFGKFASGSPRSTIRGASQSWSAGRSTSPSTAGQARSWWHCPRTS